MINFEALDETFLMWHYMWICDVIWCIKVIIQIEQLYLTDVLNKNLNIRLFDMVVLFYY